MDVDLHVLNHLFTNQSLEHKYLLDLYKEKSSLHFVVFWKILKGVIRPAWPWTNQSIVNGMGL
jgi:hypothetical protein